MTTRPRDTQRKRVYTSERVLPYESVRTFANAREVQLYVNRLMARQWFTAMFPLTAIRGVVVKPMRSDGYGAYAQRRRIVIGRFAWNHASVLHEMAHVVIGDLYDGHRTTASHGPEFASILLILVRQTMGKNAALTLKRSYDENKVRYCYVDD